MHLGGYLYISALLPCHFKIVLKEFVNYFVMLQVDILKFEKKDIFYSDKNSYESTNIFENATAIN